VATRLKLSLASRSTVLCGETGLRAAAAWSGTCCKSLLRAVWSVAVRLRQHVCARHAVQVPQTASAAARLCTEQPWRPHRCAEALQIQLRLTIIRCVA
jgi:hypothetical protein